MAPKVWIPLLACALGWSSPAAAALEIPPAELLGGKIVATIVSGRVVHETAAFGGRSAR